MKNNILNKETDNFASKKIFWPNIQTEMKNQFGKDIYESWIRKIEFINEFNDYILISVSTRFIRDWITSRYLDQILKIVKSFKKNINRIEFIVRDIELDNKDISQKQISSNIDNEKISFIKDSYLQYNRIDPNKTFDNFVLRLSNKLA